MTIIYYLLKMVMFILYYLYSNTNLMVAIELNDISAIVISHNSYTLHPLHPLSCKSVRIAFLLSPYGLQAAAGSLLWALDGGKSALYRFLAS